MKKLLIVFMLPVLLTLVSCDGFFEQSLTQAEIEMIETQIDKQFDQMLNLAKNGNHDDFNKIVDQVATLAVEGFEIPSESVKDYTFEVFRSLTDKDIIILPNHYYVLSRDLVYVDIYARPIQTDTVKGISLKPPPMALRYLSGKEAGNFKPADEKPGDETYKIMHSTITQIKKPVEFRVPIKTLKFTIIYDKSNIDWKFLHGHVSLGLKRSVTFDLK